MLLIVLASQNRASKNSEYQKNSLGSALIIVNPYDENYYYYNY